MLYNFLTGLCDFIKTQIEALPILILLAIPFLLTVFITPYFLIVLLGILFFMFAKVGKDINEK